MTGGTAGLGLALAELLAAKGAHVSIVARNQGRLDAALAKLEVGPVEPAESKSLLSGFAVCTN